MRIKPSIGSVVGQTDDAHWGQVLTLPLAYGVVELTDQDGFAAADGIKLLTSLTHALEQAPVRLKDLERLASTTVVGGINTVLLLVPLRNVIYVALVGEGAVYLKRGSQLAPLLTQHGGISGEVQKGDMILLVSKGFTDVFTQTELATCFDHLSAPDAAEKLTLMLHEREGGKGAAALVFDVSEFIAEEEETTPAAVAESLGLPVGRRKRFFGVVKRILHERKLPSLHTIRSHFSSEKAPAQKKIVAAIVLVLFCLFAVSVLLGIQKQAAAGKNQKIVQVLDDAQHGLDEGLALLDLNAVKGRERLVQAKTLLEPLLATVSDRTKEGRQVKNLYHQVTDALTQAMHVVSIEPQLFYDVSLLKKDARASNIALVDDMVGISDVTGKTVYALTISSKNGVVVGGGDAYAGLSFVAAHGDKVYALVDGGIHMIRTGDNKTVPLVVKKDTAWGTIGAMVSYGGNLYLLDISKNRIWKYIATDSSSLGGFSEIHEYLNPDTFPDFTKATSMSIDGSVWVATSDGKILKFTQGKEDTFVPQGVDPAFGTNLLLYTSDAVKNLYVVDVQSKRVVVLDKTGLYIGAYVWKTPVMPTALVVSEEQKKILLLSDGRLYSIELK